MCSLAESLLSVYQDLTILKTDAGVVSVVPGPVLRNTTCGVSACRYLTPGLADQLPAPIGVAVLVVFPASGGAGHPRVGERKKQRGYGFLNIHLGTCVSVIEPRFITTLGNTVRPGG